MSRTWNTLPYDLWVKHPSTPTVTEYWQTHYINDCECSGDKRPCTKWQHRTKVEEVVTDVYDNPIIKYGCTCCGPDLKMENRRERRYVKRALKNWGDDEFSGRYYRENYW